MSKNVQKGGRPMNERVTIAGDSILEPSEILGATNNSGELLFLIRWKGTNQADMVTAKVANIKWPQLVIKFYEDRVIFRDVP